MCRPAALSRLAEMLKLFAKALAFGTTRYPEKVARRLRVVNLVSWCGSLLIAQFAVRRFIDPTPGMMRLGFIAAGISLAFASIPLLHRFGSWTAIFALAVLGFADTIRVTRDGGTGGGYWLALMDACALAVLLLGAERLVLSLCISVAAVALLVFVHAYFPFDTGELSPEHLRAAFFTNLVFHSTLIFAVVIYAARQIAQAEAAAEKERERSDALLFNIMPESIAERLKRAPDEIVADRHEDVSVLFADMAGFTARSAAMSPEALVGFLGRLFAEFDRLIAEKGAEKIKSNGDAYMVAAGLPSPRPDHAEVLADLALEMRDAAARFDVRLRIGIASGPVVAGVIGSRKYFYDIWGDTVNVASRMESTAEVGRIQVAESTAARLRGRFRLEQRGPVEVKGKGTMTTWHVLGRFDT